MKKVFIVIINYNGEKDTKECLNSLKKINHSGFEMHTVVVDNDPKNRIKLNKKDFSEIVQAAKPSDTEIRRINPIKLGSVKNKKEALNKPRLIWLRGSGSNRRPIG